MIGKHLKYMGYVLRHKWFVLVECYRLGVLWRGVVHDLSKLRWSEWWPYAWSFNGPWAYRDRPQWLKDAFDRAWLCHQHRNPHHWQHWILRLDSPDATYLIQEMGQVEGGSRICHHPTGIAVEVPECDLMANKPDVDAMVRKMIGHANSDAGLVVLPMPDKYRREMLADWRGAGKAQGKPDTRAWYEANKNKIVLHAETREWIEANL